MAMRKWLVPKMPDGWAVKLGRRVQARREELGWSLEELAERTLTRADSLGAWECGQTCPPAFTILCLAQALNVSVDWLLTGREFVRAAGSAPAEVA